MRADDGTSISLSFSPDFGDFMLNMSASPVNTSSGLGTPAPAFGSYLGVFGSYSLPFTGSGTTAADRIFMSFRTSFNSHLTYIQIQFGHNSFAKSWELLSYDIVYSDDGWNNWNDINTNVAYL